MNIASSHEMSQANYLNLDVYTTFRYDPWQRDLNLLDVCSFVCISKDDIEFINKGFEVIQKTKINVLTKV
jgi:hypothetical protein